MSVTKALNAIAGGSYIASKQQVPSGGGGGGSGDVTGPGSSTDDNIVLFNGGTGKIIKDSGQTIADVLSDAETYTDGEIAALSAVYQPLDSDLTSIAALATTSFGRGLLELAGASSGWKLTGVQQFTSDGTYTPSSGTTHFLVFGVGGGGGGGGVGSSAAAANTRNGGGRGGAGELRVAVLQALVSSYTVTVGAVGTGGAAGNNSGNAGGNTVINDGSTDIFVCNGGAAGGGSPGNSNGSAGASGTGGTGGIELSSLLVAGGSFPSFNSTAQGNFNVLFGLPVSAVANATSDSTGSLVLSSGATGSTGLGRGSAGSGGWHWNGSTSTFGGGIGSRGYLLIIEFGY